MDGLRDLGGGVWLSQSPLWETNAVLALAGGEALLCDPGYTPDDVARLAAAAGPAGTLHVLVTHADFDHVCGLPYVPDAVVVAGEATAARIRSGEAGRDLADAGREWGVDWLDGLRVDRVVPPGETACGVFRVEAITADGHTADGLAYVLLEQGVLLAGDYLSGMTYPFLGGSLQAAISTHRRLLDALDRHELRWVVPGHGAPLPPADARSVGEADLAYLEALAAAAAEARERDLPPGLALLHVFAVEPPRPTTLDFELFGVRAANASAVLGDA